MAGRSVRVDAGERMPQPSFLESLRPWRVTIEGANQVDVGLTLLRSEFDEPSIEESRLPNLGAVSVARQLHGTT